MTSTRWATLLVAVWFVLPTPSRSSLAGAPAPAEPVFSADPISDALRTQLTQKGFKVEKFSGNFLSPRVYSKTRGELLLPITINGKIARDLRGHVVFLRESIRARLLAADKAMFEKKKQHIAINYGFRSNSLQEELYGKLKGKGKVAPAGQSFHETGMALDLLNWREAQGFMIDAGFVGGCYGIEEDLVHYSVDEITKASNLDAFKRCTLKEIPEQVVKGVKKAGGAAKAGIGSGIKKLKRD